MSEKHSIASKARWANKSPEERKEIMTKVINRRWAKTSKEDRTKFAYKMVLGKKMKLSK